MWIALFTIMPVIFGYFFFMYLKNTQTGSREAFQETNKLILLWIALSFLLDAIVYIVFIPIFLGAQPNWTFFPRSISLDLAQLSNHNNIRTCE